jgi:hypothetical protein
MKIRAHLPIWPLLLTAIVFSSVAAAESASTGANHPAEDSAGEVGPVAEPARSAATAAANHPGTEQPEALERAQHQDEAADGEEAPRPGDDADLELWDEDDEEEPEEDGEDEILPIRIGIGVGLSSRTFALFGDDSTTGAPVSFTNIQVPIYLGTSFRLEPEIGFYHQKGGISSGLAGLVGSVGDSRTTSVRFLLGAQYAYPLSTQTIAYVGPKVGIQSRSMQFQVEVGDLPLENTEIRALDYWAGGSVGGEAFLTDHFSLGVEVDFFYVNLGETTAVAGEFSLRKGSHRSWILSTHGLLAARLYFL